MRLWIPRRLLGLGEKPSSCFLSFLRLVNFFYPSSALLIGFWDTRDSTVVDAIIFILKLKIDHPLFQAVYIADSTAETARKKTE